MSVPGSEYERELAAVEGVDGATAPVAAAPAAADSAAPPRVLVSGGSPSHWA